MSDVSISAVTLVLQTLDVLGLDSRAVGEEAGLPPSEIAARKRISWDQFIVLLERASRVLDSYNLRKSRSSRASVSEKRKLTRGPNCSHTSWSSLLRVTRLPATKVPLREPKSSTM